MHDGILDIRDTRFAHAGVEAEHECSVHLMDGPEGKPMLRPTYSASGPGPLIDYEQRVLWERLAAKVKSGAEEAREAARSALQAYLDSADGRGIREQLEQQPGKHASPEQQAISVLQTMFGGAEPAGDGS